MRTVNLLPVLAASVLFAGCAVGPNYHTPRTVLPGTFAADSTQPTTTPSSAVDITSWWQSFHDDELNALVERAVAANYDIEIALARLQEARTLEVSLGGSALPYVEASGAMGRGTGTNTTKGRISAPLNAASNTTGLREITQIVGFDSGWELDLFGHYRRLIEAAHFDTQAAAETRNIVLITVVADVARAYADTRAFQLRLKILSDNIQTQQQSVDLVTERFNRGLTNELDVALAKRQLATLKAEVAPLRDQLETAQRRLAVLSGEYPDQLHGQLTNSGSLPQAPAEIQAGIPVELLRRRPDIREAERELAASTARIGAAEANLFPRVAVTAGVGIQGQGLGRDPVRYSDIWSAGPSAYWPLLDFGTLDALIDLQDLHTHELLVNYKRTILNAVEEVENAISGFQSQEDRLANLADALAASQRAVSLASQRYDRGLTDFLNVLDAERQMYDLQDQYAVAQEDVLLQFIALYKGLGGGWQNYQTIPPIRRPEPAIIATVHRLAASDDANK